MNQINQSNQLKSKPIIKPKFKIRNHFNQSKFEIIQTTLLASMREVVKRDQKSINEIKSSKAIIQINPFIQFKSSEHS